MATSNSNFFIAKNGLAVGNTTSTKAVVDNSGRWIGVPIADSYARDLANSASANTIYTQGVDDYQNTQIISVNQFAQAAYNQANTGSGSGITIITGSQYVDYGWIYQSAGPVQFDYGTL